MESSLDAFHSPCCSKAKFSVKSSAVILKQSVTYIVAGVMLRTAEHNSGDELEVLLIQEAKRSCRGLWYLPAGRLEKNESLQIGMARELMEESGLEGNIETLLSVELGDAWFRFTFLLSHSGGKLKTTAEADNESLQAGWFPVHTILKRFEDPRLRHDDVMKLIKFGTERYSKVRTVCKTTPITVLPIEKPIPCLSALFFIVDDTGVNMLVNEDDGDFPVIHWLPGSTKQDLFAHCLCDFMNNSARIISLTTCPRTELDGVSISICLSLQHGEDYSSTVLCENKLKWIPLSKRAKKKLDHSAVWSPKLVLIT